MSISDMNRIMARFDKLEARVRELELERQERAPRQPLLTLPKKQVEPVKDH